MINQSEHIDELSAALALAQAELRNADKNKKAYNYCYADLSQILDIARPSLAKHGLSVIQLPSDGIDAISLTTRLCHKSGQWIETTMRCEIPQNTKNTHVQQMGSMITYMRRYAMSAILSISADEDNDGAVVAERKTAVGKRPEHKKYRELLALADSMRIDDSVQDLWLAKTGKQKWEDVPEQQVEALYGKLLQKMRAQQQGEKNV